MAKIGLEMAPTNTKVPHTDMKLAINKLILSGWQNRWDSQVSNKLRSIQENIKPKSQTPQNRRRDETVLTRIRLGHSYMTHTYLLKNEDRPRCIQCNTDLSLHHILLDCVDFSDARKRFYNCRTLKQLFDMNIPKQIISFLKEIGIYDRI